MGNRTRAEEILRRLQREAWRPVLASGQRASDGDPCLVLDLGALPEAARATGFVELWQEPVRAVVREVPTRPLAAGSIGRWWSVDVIGFERVVDDPRIDEFVAEEDEELALVLEQLGERRPLAGDKLLGHPVDAFDVARDAGGVRLGEGDEAPTCPVCGEPLEHLLTVDAETLPTTTSPWGHGRALVFQCPVHRTELRAFAQAIW